MANSESGFGTNFFEYSVIKKPDKKTKTKKLVFTSSIFLVWAVATVLLFSFMNGVAIVFVPLLLLLSIILLWYLLRFTNLEYDYEISGGEMTMSVVYGGRTRKELFKKKISDMDEISKLEDANRVSIEKDADVILECVSSFDVPDIFYLKFSEKGKKYTVYFETMKKGEKLFKFYNSSASKL